MEIILLTILLIGAWFWQDSVAKREIAVKFGRELSNRCQLQLLDETVACTRLSLGRDGSGHARLIRLYEFEASASGSERMQCQLELIGKQLKSWHIPPYLQPVH